MQTSKNRQDHRQSSGFDAPGLVGRSPVVQLRGIEPEADFKCSGFRSIGAVDDIAANVDSQVTANGAGLVDFITSGPVVAMVWEGDGVIASARKLIGATKPLEAEPGTIRGDLAINIGRNVIHGSDAAETAAFEIGLWFDASELNDWSPSDQEWRVEG